MCRALEALTRHGSSPCNPDTPARRPARVTVYRAGWPANRRWRESSRSRSAARKRARAEATVVPLRSARASAVMAPMRATHCRIATRSGEGIRALSKHLVLLFVGRKAIAGFPPDLRLSGAPWAQTRARYPCAAAVAQPDHRRPALPETHDVIRAEDALTGAGACQPSVAVARGSPGAPRSCQARDQLGRLGYDLAVGDQH